MPNDELNIKVTADLTGLTQLDATAKATASSVTGSFEQMNAAASGTAKLSEASLVASAKVLDLKAALAQVSAELKETTAMVIEAGGSQQVGASIIQQYNKELVAQATLQSELAAATKVQAAALNELVEATAAAAAVEASRASSAAAEAEEAAIIAANTSATEENAAAKADLAEVEAAGVAVTEERVAAEAGLVETESAVAASEAQVTEATLTETEARLLAADAIWGRISAELEAGEVAEASAETVVAANEKLAMAYQQSALANQLLVSARQRAVEYGLSEANTTKLISSYQQQATVSAELCATAENNLAAAIGRTAAASEFAWPVLKTEAQIQEQIAITGDAAAGGVSKLSSALAFVTARSAGSVAGLGSASFAMGRLAASSSSLAPILAAVFPVLLIGMATAAIDKLISSIDKVQEKVGMETAEWLRSSEAIHDHYAGLEIENLKLEDQLAKLENRPEPNPLVVGLLEAQRAAEKLYDSLSKDVDAQRKLLEEKGISLWDRAVTGLDTTGDILDKTRVASIELSSALTKQSDIYATNADAIAKGAAKTATAAEKAAADRATAADRAADAEVENSRKALAEIIKNIQAEDAAGKARQIASLQLPQREGESKIANVPGLSEADAVKEVNRQFAARDAILTSLSHSLRDIGLAEKAQGENTGLKGQVATAAQLKTETENAAKAAKKLEEEQLKQITNTEKIAEAQAKLDASQKKLEAPALSATAQKKESGTPGLEEENARFAGKQTAALATFGVVTTAGDKDKQASASTEMVTNALEHQTNVNNLMQAARVADAKDEQEIGLTKLANSEKIIDEQAKQDEAAAKEKYENHQISALALAKADEEIENKRFAAANAVNQAKITKAKQDPSTAGQKEQADAETQARLAVMQSQARIAEIRSTGNKEDIADTLRTMESKVSATKELEDATLSTTVQMEDRKLAAHQESLGKWAADERAALTKWKDDQMSGLNELITFMKQHYLTDTDQYRQAVREKDKLNKEFIDKSLQLDQQLEIKQRQMLNFMTTDFNNAFAQWISGSKRPGLAFAQMFDNMVNTAVMSLVKIGEQQLLTELLFKSSFARTLFNFIESLGQKKATEASANTSSVAASAGTAAAAAGAAAFVATPFPGDFAAAATASAAAGAQVLAAGSVSILERGGITEGGLALLHKNEMVLPRNISEGVQNMVSNNTSSRGGDQHFNFNPNVNALDSDGVGRVLQKSQREFIRQASKIMRYGARTRR